MFLNIFFVFCPFLSQVMECQLSAIRVRHRVLIKVTSAPLCSCKSIHTVNRSWQRQPQHIINDNSPSRWREHLTTTAHGSNFHAMPSCYVQSGIHLLGLSHTDADITRLTCKHLIPQSYVRPGAVPAKCWQRRRHYSCIFLLLLSFNCSLYWRQFSS